MSEKIEISKEEYEEIMIEKIEKLEKKIFPNEERIVELKKITEDSK